MRSTTNRITSPVVLAGLMALGLAGTLPGAALGATTPQQQLDQNAPIFQRLFQNPTNNNGYEEFVLAADLIKNIDEIDLLMQPGASLDFKRHVLAIPACEKALNLVRNGLAKQVRSPHTSIDQNTVFPELSLFRKIARLLATEQYVDFADGRGDAAVESLRTGLTFGYRIQYDTFIAGLVGIAVSSITTREFASHFDQLSIYQCDDVVAFARQLLAADTPAVALIEKEKSTSILMLDKCRNQPQALLDLFAGSISSFSPNDTASFDSLKSRLSTQPASLNLIIADAQSKVSALYDLAAASVKLPLSQRAPLTMDGSNTPVAAVVRLVTADPQKILDKYTIDQVRVRLLAVHALIRRFQWDHGTLPGSLTELHAEDIIIDPFTGNTITYKRDGDRYTLSSAGPLTQDGTTGAVTQERTPVTLR